MGATGKPTQEMLIEAAENFARGWSMKGDSRWWTTLFADGAEYVDASFGSKTYGEMGQYFHHDVFYQAFPEFDVQVLETLTGDDHVTFTYHFRGTMQNDLPVLPPTSSNAYAVFRSEGELVKLTTADGQELEFELRDDGHYDTTGLPRMQGTGKTFEVDRAIGIIRLDAEGKWTYCREYYDRLRFLMTAGVSW